MVCDVGSDWDAHLTVGGGRSSPRCTKDQLVGGSLRDVQMLAGHSSLAVTQRYIEGDGEARVKVVELCNF